MTDTPSQSIGVTVRGLRKSYDGQLVLKGIDLSVEPGEIFVIMGPSGSGKSVLLRHVIGLEQPDEGDILLEGQSIHTTNVSERYRLAMVFQSAALLSSLSVAENVGLYLTEHRSRKPDEVDRIVTEKLEFLGLKGVKKKLPSELSGGMKKRVAIARALIIDPHLILYDEPTSELDPLMTVTIREEILALKERIHVTSLVVSHDRDLAFGVADRMAIMNDGEILFVGTPEEVRRSSHPFIRQFLSADFKFKQHTDPS